MNSENNKETQISTINNVQEKNYTKEYNLYYIGSSLLVIISVILGAILLHTYLRSIDALMLFSSGLINDFISLSLVSFIFISILLVFFSIQYWIPYIIYNKINLKSKRLIIIRDKKTQEMLNFNIPALLLILCVSLYIIAFNKLNYESDFSKADDYYKFFSLYCICIYTLIFLSLITYCKNKSYYKKLRFFLNYRKSDGLFRNIKYFPPYLLGVLLTFGLFLQVCFFFIMLFGMHEINSLYDLLNSFYYIFIVYVTFFLMPIDYTNYTFKEKFYKVFSFSLLCLFFMGVSSHFFETKYINNLMRVIGKADSKTMKYVIMNANKYGLEDVTYKNKKDNNVFGKVLWRDEKFEIFLLKEDLNNISKRKIIDKKDIHLFQGNN